MVQMNTQNISRVTYKQNQVYIHFEAYIYNGYFQNHPVTWVQD